VKPLKREASAEVDILQVGMIHVAIWGEAARGQIRRLKADCPDGELDEENIADVSFLAISLANLQTALARCAEACEILMQVEGRDRFDVLGLRSVKNAERLLHEGCPDVRHMRNIFSHFEDYGYGLGRAQASEVPLRLVYYEDEPMRLGLDDGSTVSSLDVNEVGDVLRRLFHEWGIFLASWRYAS
jgi:hypothetical protein